MPGLNTIVIALANPLTFSAPPFFAVPTVLVLVGGEIFSLKLLTRAALIINGEVVRLPVSNRALVVMVLAWLLSWIRRLHLLGSLGALSGVCLTCPLP